MKLIVFFTCSILLSLGAEAVVTGQHVAGSRSSSSSSKAYAARERRKDDHADLSVVYHSKEPQSRDHFLHATDNNAEAPSEHILPMTHQHMEVSQQTLSFSNQVQGSRLNESEELAPTHASFASMLTFIITVVASAALVAFLWSMWAPRVLPTKGSPPQDLEELFDTQTIDYHLPNSVFGDAVLQFTICSAMHSTARQNRTPLPWTAYCRTFLCCVLIVMACFVQIYVSWNLDVKLAQQRYGLRAALRQCEIPLAASCDASLPNVSASPLFWPDLNSQAAARLDNVNSPLPSPNQIVNGNHCCTRDQVCGEVNWRYYCSERPHIKNLHKDPFGTQIWGSMACGFHRVSETYYEFEDTVYPRWPWLVSCVLLIWLCLMAKDLRTQFFLTRAVTSRPKVARASEQISQEGDVVEVVGMTRSNCFAIMMFVVVPKFLVVIYVAYVGCRMLHTTSGVIDLVLDGVALVFLIEADEMIFYGFTGSVMKEVLKNSKSFTLNNYKASGVFGYDLFVMVASALVIMVIVLYWVHDDTRYMGHFIEEACKPLQ